MKSEQRRASSLAVHALVVVLVAFFARAEASSFEFVYLDDDVLILEDQASLTGPSSLERSFTRPYLPAKERDHAYYRPIVSASYALDAHIGGPDPRAYHWTNVLLNTLAAVLAFLVLRALTLTDGAALFGALIFAVHPALTSAIAWIPGRPDLLLTSFALAGWLAFACAVRTGSPVAKILHHVFWLGALFSKEAALVLPFIYVLWLVLLERRSPRSLIPLAPWLLGWPAVLAIYAAARASAVSGTGGLANVVLGDAVANASVFLTSLGKLVVPVRLSVLATRSDTALWPGLVALGVIAALVFVARVPRARVLFASAFFVLAVLPNLPASRVLVLESRLYLPALAVVFVLAAIAEQAPGSAWMKRGAAALGVAALALTSLAYGKSFSGRIAFAEAAVRGAPHSALAHRNLGVAYQRSGRRDLARREYEAALREDPTQPVVNNNLGVLFMAEGRLDDAERHLRRELELYPSYAPARENLSLVLRAQGQPLP